MRVDALYSIKTIASFNRENLRENLTLLRTKYVKPQSMATAKQISTTGLPLSESEVFRFSRRTLETSEKRNRSCCSGDQRENYKCLNASQTEKIG